MTTISRTPAPELEANIGSDVMAKKAGRLGAAQVARNFNWLLYD